MEYLSVDTTSMPSNRPVPPSFHAQHKNNRLCSKIVNLAPLRVPQATLCLCNVAVLDLQPWKVQRCKHFARFVSRRKASARFDSANGSSRKTLKIAGLPAYRSLPFAYLFCSVEDCNVPFVSFVSYFCFFKNECSLSQQTPTLHILFLFPQK